MISQNLWKSFFEDKIFAIRGGDSHSKEEAVALLRGIHQSDKEFCENLNVILFYFAFVIYNNSSLIESIEAIIERINLFLPQIQNYITNQDEAVLVKSVLRYFIFIRSWKNQPL